MEIKTPVLTYYKKPAGCYQCDSPCWHTGYVCFTLSGSGVHFGFVGHQEKTLNGTDKAFNLPVLGAKASSWLTSNRDRPLAIICFSSIPLWNIILQFMKYAIEDFVLPKLKLNTN